MIGKRTLLGLTATALTSTALGLSAPRIARAAGTVKFGFAPWADAEFITRLAARLTEQRLETKVELVQTDVAPLYQGLLRGDVDAMLMCWLPQTHADYWTRVEGKVERLGVLYSGARLGWVVPAYVPEAELGSIADLAKADVRGKLGGRIQGIEPGAGLTRLSRKTIEEYGLDYTLQESSEAAMLSMVERAMRRENWVVATAWSPHWMFGKHELRYLADPKGTLGGQEEVLALGKPGLAEQQPQLARFLSRLNMPLAELEAAMLVAQEKSPDAAVEAYIGEHGSRIDGWFRA
ncbi:glycine betaine ABC transporter substrate-binding protein [Pseudoroseomonas cervicalis]|uniref:glycine betaine ABC transporter substrate-binding protein n=1 Tax=Teichococcus cervicalis TaxID=204525 RepID=UPI002784DCDD|nr:glycine betaine ABC transporter substrate-binding protein [Pseudoroseomonas cervicalis]MDQ1077783.1 glycine betaine/proline transport system substrate-binding protein [Pseudoroseomonas cervicalis]